jgi:Outer membrane lipoprotein carrier protein LolA-like
MHWAIALLALIGWASAPAWGEDAQQLAPGDVLRGRFVQERFLEGFAAPLKTTGTFVLAPGKGLIWHAEAPFAVTTVMTASGISQRSGDSEILNLASTQVPFLARLYDILGGALAGDLQPLERYFRVKRTSDAAGWHLALAPRDSSELDRTGLHEIRIAGQRFVKTVDIARQTGDRDRLTFLDQTLDASDLAPEEAALLGKVGRE